MTISKIDMPVISIPHNLVDLEQFCSDFQAQDSHGRQTTKIISFSQKIDPIDPLAVLAHCARSSQLHFYWENPSQEEAIVAFGSVDYYTIESRERFKKSQKFTQDCLKQTLSIGDLHLPGAGPHLFCSFSFFPEQNKKSAFAGATIFLPSWHVTRKKEDFVLVVNIPISEAYNLRKKVENIQEQLQKINRAKKQIKIYKKAKIKSTKNHQQDFTDSVKSALEAIKENKFKKIVLAQVLDLVAEDDFNVIAALEKLRKSHPDCYIFSVSNGKGQNFLGASPERLLSIENQQLLTDALAGSASRGKTAEEDREIALTLLKSEKERREHQAVSEYITKRLWELGLEPESGELQLLKLSNIQHLWTPIKAALAGNFHPLEIVAQLHPTPAVAGVPTGLACEEIRRYENFERGLYAAPLGWLDYQGNGKFIVGIRSALIQGNQARLYAGAGIVEGSDPDKEFAEVQLKLQSLLKAL